MNTKILVLIDGSSLLFRAYHSPALSRLTTKDGQPSGTVFGFNRSLNLIINHYQPEGLCVVFDPQGKTVRHDWFESYKANRPATPQEIIDSFAAIQQLLEYRNIAQLSILKQEADDVIGSLSVQAEAQDWQVKIISGDKDLAQLVTAQVSLCTIQGSKLTELDESGVSQKFGVAPKQMADWLALTGDSVDNIPGVAGIGPKKASQLLQKFHSLEGVQQNLQHIPGKIGEAIRQQLNNLPMYQKLTQINIQLKTGVCLQEFVRQPPNHQQRQRLKDFYYAYDFRRELNLLEHDLEKQAQSETTPVELSSNPQKPNFQQGLMAVLEANQRQQPLQVVLVKDLLGLYCAYDQTYYFHVMASNKEALTLYQSLVDSPAPRYAIDWKEIARALTFDRHHQPNHNPPEPQWQDLMLMSYVLNAGLKSHHWPTIVSNLEAAKTQPEEAPNQLQQKLKKPQQQWTPQECLDSIQNRLLNQYQLQQLFEQKLQQTPNLSKLYREVENPLKSCLYEIEKRGVYIDQQKLLEVDHQLAQKATAIQQQIYALSEEPFNLDSPKQVGEILYQKLGLPVLKKTPSGSPSTNEQALQELAESGSDIAELIIRYRGLTKLQSTYTRGLPKHLAQDARIHTHLNQAVTTTGRLSSSAPNLQNIPIKTAEGRLIRQAFCAAKPSSHCIMAFDYSQIELRILAYQTKDEALIDAFNNHQDIHTLTAAKVFGGDLSGIDSQQRRYAKTINFGLIYGMSAFSLSRQLGINVEQAKQWVDEYFAQFPKVYQYMGDIKQLARRQGYVETLWGRRIYLPDINSRNHGLRSYAERAAINAPIQGGASDIIKMAMLAVNAKITNAEEIQLILQIHDELLFEVDQLKVDFYRPIISACMKQVVDLSVPLEVEVGVGLNWDEAH